MKREVRLSAPAEFKPRPEIRDNKALREIACARLCAPSSSNSIRLALAWSQMQSDCFTSR